MGGCNSCNSGCNSGCGGRFGGNGGDAIHRHGICDCEEDDHCATRMPWLRMSMGHAVEPSEPLPAPTKLPKGLD
jgi:hypothetical protein